MIYHVNLTKDALKFLKELDKHTALFLTAWIRKNLEGCSDPRAHGKGLTANRSGQWRYRVGDYGIGSGGNKDKVLWIIVKIGHRRDIYG